MKLTWKSLFCWRSRMKSGPPHVHGGGSGRTNFLNLHRRTISGKSFASPCLSFVLNTREPARPAFHLSSSAFLRFMRIIANRPYSQSLIFLHNNDFIIFFRLFPGVFAKFGDSRGPRINYSEAADNQGAGIFVKLCSLPGHNSRAAPGSRCRWHFQRYLLNNLLCSMLGRLFSLWQPNVPLFNL